MARLGIKAGKGQIWVCGQGYQGNLTEGERVVIEGLVRAEKVCGRAQVRAEVRAECPEGTRSVLYVWVWNILMVF